MVLVSRYENNSKTNEWNSNEIIFFKMASSKQPVSSHVDYTIIPVSVSNQWIPCNLKLSVRDYKKV